ncbi:hypothetical protein GGF31_000042 [Allomyces arbusculus]|nr:hypothetical protein GGF31_000042 [Allomyces arbusculus]
MPALSSARAPPSAARMAWPWLALASVALLVAAAPPAAHADLVVGKGGCKGVDISASKYCKAFGSQFLSPTNLTSPVAFTLVRNLSIAADAQYISSLRVDNIQNVDDFDHVVYNVILSILPDVNHRWFRCPLKSLGVKYALTFYCNLLLNSNADMNASACTTIQTVKAASKPGLCKATSDEAFNSARTHQLNDDSCPHSSDANAKFSDDIGKIQTMFIDPNASPYISTDAKCVSGTDNEGASLCGYANNALACSNGCANASGCTGNITSTDSNSNKSSDSTTSSGGVSTGAIVGAVVGGIVVVAAAGAGFVVYRRRQRAQQARSTLQYMDSKPPAAANGMPLGTLAGGPQTSNLDVPVVGKLGGLSSQTQVMPRDQVMYAASDVKPVPTARTASPLLVAATTGAALARAGGLPPSSPVPPPPLSNRMSTLTPPPRTSFYDTGMRDDDTIIPEESASNIGINPRFRPDRPPSRPGTQLFAPNKSSPLAPSNVGPPPSDVAAAAADAAANLPAWGLMTFPNGAIGRQVYHIYEPSAADELPIQLGDVLRVDMVFVDGWAQGCKLDSAGRPFGPIGVFPVAALDPQMGSASGGDDGGTPTALATPTLYGGAQAH